MKDGSFKLRFLCLFHRPSAWREIPLESGNQKGMVLLMEATTLTPKPNGRLNLLDELRGFCLVLMIVYHAIYDIEAIFGMRIPFFLNLDTLSPVEPFFAGIFIAISGFVCSYSHSNLVRGAKLLAVALGLTVVTRLLSADLAIYFGVLHFLACAMILFALLAPILRKIPPAVLIPVNAALFLLTWNLPVGYLGFGPLSIHLPTSFYSTPFLFPIGLPNLQFYSTDYFPLFPWIFLFLGAYGVSVLFQKHPLKWVEKGAGIRPLSFLGRHSLLIYLIHQPAIMAIFYAIDFLRKL